MAPYLASQIIKGSLDYKAVTERYPQYKADLDAVLTERGAAYLILE